MLLCFQFCIHLYEPEHFLGFFTSWIHTGINYNLFVLATGTVVLDHLELIYSQNNLVDRLVGAADVDVPAGVAAVSPVPAPLQRSPSQSHRRLLPVSEFDDQ